jgi:hypothetical protein
MADSPPPLSTLSGGTTSEESRPPLVPIAIGAAAVLIVIAVLVIFGRNQSSENASSSASDPYAANLALSGLAMSTADNFAGQQVTYIEGKINNHGPKTVNGALVQVVFHDSMGQVAQKDTQRLMIITTREPYIDTAPLSSVPLQPGQTREFRLTFEHVSAEWNMQVPDLTLVKISTH